MPSQGPYKREAEGVSTLKKRRGGHDWGDTTTSQITPGAPRSRKNVPHEPLQEAVWLTP